MPTASPTVSQEEQGLVVILDVYTNNPEEVASRLHLGVTPLGLAYALASGWMETSFYGDMRLRGAREDTANVTEMLQSQVRVGIRG